MDLVALRTDLAFRAVFGRDNEKCKIALKELLSISLDLDIHDLRYVNPLNLQEYEGDKQSEMDIEVETETGELINVEIQLKTTKGFKQRIVYYGAKLLGEALGEKETYDKLRECKVLSILDFILFPQTDALVNRFCLKEREQNFEFSDVLELVFMEMPKLQEKAVTAMSPVEKWLYFLRYVQDEDKSEKITAIIKESEGLQMAYKVLSEVSADRTLRTKIRFQEKAQRDHLSQLAYAEELGIKQGLEQGAKKTARNLLIHGMPPQTVAEMTELTLAEVEALQKSL